MSVIKEVEEFTHKDTESQRTQLETRKQNAAFHTYFVIEVLEMHYIWRSTNMTCLAHQEVKLPVHCLRQVSMQYLLLLSPSIVHL